MKIIIEKGDSEEQIKMAEALLANKLVSAIETVTYKCQKVYKSDDEVAKAVIVVVGSRDVGIFEHLFELLFVISLHVEEHTDSIFFLHAVMLLYG